MREAANVGIAATLQAAPKADGRMTVPAVAERKVRLGFAFALGCTVLIGAVSYLSVARLLQRAVDTVRVHEMAGNLERLLAAAADSQAAERGFVITGDDSYLVAFRQAAAVIENETRRLRSFVEEHLVERERLDAAAALMADLLRNERSVMELRKNQDFAAAQREILAGKDSLIHDQIRSAIAQMQNTGTVEYTERVRQTRVTAMLALTVIIGGGVLAVGFAGFTLLAVRRDFAELGEQALRDANEKLESRDLERLSSEHAALTQMASGLAHDINNAVSPVTLYVDSLLEGEPGLSARGREQLQIIQRAVDRVARTVARLREVYRSREP